MSRQDEDSPVYYREIQKNAYLKRIPEDSGGSKLRPLGHKKPPLKPMWTLFCVHNGRVPYLEQYPSIDAPCTASHRPLWRACLRTARHVTASVTPRGNEHDFLIHTDSGPLRLLAPDWESMQDWVTTLRTKLHELKILPKGENVYCAAPAPPPPRAGTRDPTSPLPPTPPVPPDRVPGIELVTPVPRPTPAPAEPPSPEPEPAPQPSATSPTTPQSIPAESVDTNIDISDWESTLNLASLPTTSNVKSKDQTRKKLKICGQNICLDDSIFNRAIASSDDEEFFSEIDRINSVREEETQGCAASEGENGKTGQRAGEDGLSPTGGLRRLTIDKEEDVQSATGFKSPEVGAGKEEAGEGSGFKQRLVVGSEGKAGTSHEQEDGEYQSTNITVIQVSNKPPHTAIPILGPETDVFNFDFQHKLTVSPDLDTEAPTYKHNVAVQSTEKDNYRQNFAVKDEGDTKTGNFKRSFAVESAAAAAAAAERAGGQYVNVVNTEVGVDPGYGTVFSDDKKESNYGHISLTTTVSFTGATSNANRTEGIYERLSQASTSTNLPSPLPRKKLKPQEKPRKSSLPNLDIPSSNTNQTYEYLYPGTNPNRPSQSPTVNNTNPTLATPEPAANSSLATPISNQGRGKKNQRENSGQVNASSENAPNTSNTRSSNRNNPRGIYISSVPVSGANVDGNTNALRSNVERSHSQNAYDSPRLRDRFIRRDNVGKLDVKNDSKPVQSKPIWKRGLTELSLLSRLRGIGQGKRADSPTRNDCDRHVAAAVKAQPRSRRDSGDSTRRRSSSLSNGQPALASVRAREAGALAAAQARGAAVPARVPRAPLLCEHDGALWVAWWGPCGAWHGGRAGDRLAALRGRTVADLQHARALIAAPPSNKIDILFHRVPLAKIYLLNKEREDEGIGIKLDNDCSISSVEAGSPAARAGLPPAGAWAVTECNNRPLNLVKGGQDDLNRLSALGKEVSVLIQPVALVRKLRAAMKANKTLLGLR